MTLPSLPCGAARYSPHEPVVHCGGGGWLVIWTGYAGVIAGALPFITDHFALSSRLQEWVVSSMMLGAAIGALFNMWLIPSRAQIWPDGWGDLVCGRLHGSAFATNVESAAALPHPAGCGGRDCLLLRRCISRRWRAQNDARQDDPVCTSYWSRWVSYWRFCQDNTSATAVTGAPCWACWRCRRCC